MSSRCLSLPTLLTFVAGGLLLCLSPLSAVAGDKIEFSVPTVALQVPQPVPAEQQAAPKLGFQAPGAVDDMVLMDSTPVPSQVIIVSAPRKTGRDGLDSRFGDSDDNDDNNDADTASADGSLNSKQQSNNGIIDRLSESDGRDFNVASFLAERKNDRDGDRDSLHARMDAMDAAMKDTYLLDQHSSRRSSGVNEEQAWNRGFFHEGLTDLERMQKGQFMPFESDMMALDPAAASQRNQGYSSTDTTTTPDNQERNSVQSAGLAAYAAGRVAISPNVADPAASGIPQTYRPPARVDAYQNPNVFSRQEPPASPAGQVQSRPAVLPFPKRPGDVFQ